MSEAKTYADGLRDGQLQAIESHQVKQDNRMDEHSKRLRFLERTVWGLFGIVAFLEIFPVLKSFLGAIR